MNKTYRLVFNRSLGKLQVASELSTSRGAGNGADHSTKPRARAAFLVATTLALSLAATGAWADITGTNGASATGAAGATTPGADNGGGDANTLGGNGSPGQSPAAGAGGQGGSATSANAAGGHAGIGQGAVGGTGQVNSGGGGMGGGLATDGEGAGGGGSAVDPILAGVGNGGGQGGGVGYVYDGVTLSNVGVTVGGQGGDGASSGSGMAVGGAGGGGAGVLVKNGANLTVGDTVTGGQGGGGNSTAGGGGDGADGMSGSTLTNDGVITGGKGGASNVGQIMGHGNASGGAGVALDNTGDTLINTSGYAIWGGAASNGGGIAMDGEGGAGIVSLGNANIFTAGLVAGGENGDFTQADAIDLYNGGNTLTLGAGFRFQGSVISNGGDTLVLGGTDDGTFNLGQIVGSNPGSHNAYGQPTAFYGFDSYKKSGSETWTLTGPASVATKWEVQSGTLGLALGATTGTITVDPGADLYIQDSSSVVQGADGTRGTSTIGGTAGNGGAGALGVSAGTGSSIENYGQSIGGAGGLGGDANGNAGASSPNGGVGGNGGNGGDGINGDGFTLTNVGTVRGGTGGTGGDANSDVGGPAGTPGYAGAGGNGVSGANFAVLNRQGGTIAGGDAGMWGAADGQGGMQSTAGYGVTSTGAASIYNDGQIAGGRNADGSHADSVYLTGGANVLTVGIDGTFVGNVISNGGDTLQLEADAGENFAFDLSRVTSNVTDPTVSYFEGFDTFSKVGAGTVILQGNNNVLATWAVNGGTLTLGTNSSGAASIASAFMVSGTTLNVGTSNSVLAAQGDPGTNFPASLPTDTGGAGSAGVSAVMGDNVVVNNGGMIVGGIGGVGGSANGMGGLGNMPYAPGSQGSNGGIGGVGGKGGAGIAATNATITNTGYIYGGMGGAGGSANGGSGGAGGAGLNFVGLGIPGGPGSQGGDGGNGGVGGAGGQGGSGIEGFDLTVNNAAGAIIEGGEGGGPGFAAAGNGGSGGLGGAGDVGSGENGADGNAGAAGANGAVGAGGVGGVSTGSSLIKIAGTISGGVSFDGSSRADAIDVSGGGNVVELLAGGTFHGNVVSNSGPGADTFALGGDANGTFDMTHVVGTIDPSAEDINDYEIQGFANFEKDGASTWTLTGVAGTDTHWQVLQGTLAVSASNSVGGVNSSIVLNDGTTFESTAAISYAGELDVRGASTVQTDSDLTLKGVVGGPGELIKTGTGTLTLANSALYTGGTDIKAGTLVVGDGATHGSILGDITDESALAFNRSDVTSYAGAISGVGSVEQKGTGTLVLTGNSTYTGGTTISAGVLQVGAGGTTGSITGDVVDNGVLGFARTDDLEFSGNVTGTGSFNQYGSGRLTVTGNIAMDGGTTVANGSLQIGNGGTSGSVAGDILVNTLVLFNRSDDVTYAGNIAGSGAVTKKGAGMLTLTGNSSNDAGLFVVGGTVQVGNGGTTGSVTGDIDVETNLSFNRSDDVAYAGTITGAGAVAQRGAGTLVLTGESDYTGGTLIKGGTLQIGDGNTSGSIVGDVDNEGTLEFKRADDVAFAGVITGTGAVVKDGTGDLALTGANAYTGGTVVYGGSLTGDTTSLQGDIVDHALVTFNQAADGIYAGALSGDGRLAKTGAGTLILNGNSAAFAGTTSIAGGTLEVGDADHATAELGGGVTVQTDGTLRGHGTIDGDVVNGGTVRPGGSVGTLTINGNYTQTAAGTLLIDTTADGMGSALKVNGKAAIDGAAMLLLPSSDWKPNTNYQVLNATGGVSGQFATVQSNFAFVTPSLVYGTENVGFSLVRNQVSFPDVATTPNAKGASAVVESLGAGNAVYDAVLMLDKPTAVSAFNQLQGQIQVSVRTAIMDNDRYVRDAVTAHLSGVDSSATGKSATSDGGVTAWTSAWGHWGSHDGDGNAFDLSNNGSGLVVGADLPVGSDYRVGALIGSGEGTARTDSPSESSHQVNTYAGLYGAAAFGQVNVQAGAVYGWQKIDTNRTLSFGSFAGSANARYHGNTAQGYVDGSYAFEVGHSTVSPFANIAYDYLHTNAMREAGSAAALASDAEGSSITTGTLGVRGSFALDDTGALRAVVSLGWQHAWGDVTPTTILRFASGSQSFDVAGVPAARNAAAVNGGISFKVAKDVTVDATYSGQFGDHATDQSGRLSVNWAF
ncbi:autotransporter-associated beta strand repeat-containing protein [Dyella sp. C9]|uniref:autotransporter-associated beta strand repeat-containing protein n=1 Tax=Dyella sp. C9 TaxID=2202154 RepID=UPI0018E58823|nr:autotransporter-associated beta strand repeat-containing protein [Dyella sp. C9]